MIAIALSILLFVKYIFFDKSGTFSTSSVPPTPSSTSSRGVSPKAPPPSQGKSTRNTASTAVCPFVLSETSESSLAARRSPELSANHLQTAAAAMGGSQSLPGIEKLVTEGIVLSAEGAGWERKALPPTSDSLKEMSLGGLARNRSSGSLLQSMSEPSVDLALNPVVNVSVGTQTDGLGPETPKFTVGGGGEEGEVSQPDSRPPQLPLLDLPPVPRQVDECIAILKSDVSHCIEPVVFSPKPTGELTPPPSLRMVPSC